MKLDRLTSAKIKIELKKAFERKELSYAAIAAAADVHPSQVSRICRGEFRTLSHNVAQVCMALGLDMSAYPVTGKTAGLESQLEQRLHKIWKRKPTVGRRLLRLLGDLETLKLE